MKPPYRKRPSISWSSCAIGLAWIACVLAAGPRAGADPDAPCRVGVQFHLQSKGLPEESYLRHLRAFVENEMANYGLLVAYGLPDPDLDAAVRYLVQHDVCFLLQAPFVAVSDEMQRYAARFDAEDYKRLREIAGDLFLGVHWGELDSSGMKPEHYLPESILKNPARAEVKAAFTDNVRKDIDRFHAAAGDVPTAHSSALLSHWLFAEAGVDILCSEVGENIPNINMMIASNRGTARAYGRPWMIDFSTWWAPRGHAGVQVSPREGHTPWCLFTALLSAAMGGADYVQLEVDWAAYDKDYNLLPWGRALKTLYTLAKRIGPRGETVTPFAVLLGHDNGWPGVGWRIGDVRGTGLFDGIRHEFMQTRDADLSLKVLDVFYPGFERCGWDPEYPGFLAESPLGPLDIVPNNLTADRYRRYAGLVALGYHRMTETLRNVLLEYVRSGGVLVCSDTLFLDEREMPVPADIAEPLIGCLPNTDESALIELYQPRGTLDAIDGYAEAAERIEWQRHWLHPVQLTSGRVVARLDDVPFIIENPIGAGRVFYVTALNMVGSSAVRRGQEPFLYANTLYHFLHTLEDHLGDGVSFTPWTGLDHIWNRKPDGSAMLLVMNHGDMPYRRDAVAGNAAGYTTGRVAAAGDWTGWHAGSDIMFTQRGDTLAWSFDMPPKSFALFEFEKAAGREIAR